MLFTSTAMLVVPPKTVVRRPSISTSVRVLLRPLSDTVDCEVVTVPLAWLVVMLPELVKAVIVFSSSSVVVAPMRSMSSRRRIVIGRAVSESMRLIAEPVTSMRSFGAGGVVVCANAAVETAETKTVTLK